ncbi:MAG: hypothetical protein AAF488_08450 [Planctomycetota bacterium]
MSAKGPFRTLAGFVAGCFIVAAAANVLTWHPDSRESPPRPTATVRSEDPSPPARPPSTVNAPTSLKPRASDLPVRGEDEWRNEIASAAPLFEASDLPAIRKWLESTMADARDGDGDLLLELLIRGNFSEAETAAAHALVRTLLCAMLQVTEPVPPAWFGSLEGLVVPLLDAVADLTETHGSEWGPLHDLLCLEGLVTREHLPWIGDRLDAEASHSYRGLLVRLIEAIALETEDETWITRWTDHPDAQVRRAAYGALLRIDPNRVSHLTDRLVHGEVTERSVLFRGLCDHVLPEDLPFVLLELRDQRIDVDLTHGLPSYLERHGGAAFDEIIYLHGRGQDSDPYRSRAVASINHSLRGREISDDLARHLVQVCTTDPAPAVRGTALLGLSLAWDSEDREGFERWIEGLEDDPDLAPFVEGARANFTASRQLRSEGWGEPGAISHERAISLRDQ